MPIFGVRFVYFSGLVPHCFLEILTLPSTYPHRCCMYVVAEQSVQVLWRGSVSNDVGGQHMVHGNADEFMQCVVV